jgi:menaquinone-dependent protoporphyrinogen oxidase
MCEAPVFYSTTEGQTRRIAERIARVMRSAGLTSEAIDLKSADAQRVDWDRVRGAIVGASLHAGAHQKEATRFVLANRDRLNARPSWFFSVSLGFVSKNASEVAEVQKLARLFAHQARWCPRQVVCFAGRLAYTKYGWFTRWMMRWIAGKEGGATDTSRDHEYTNWATVDALAWLAAIDILAISIPKSGVPIERAGRAAAHVA